MGCSACDNAKKRIEATYGKMAAGVAQAAGRAIMATVQGKPVYSGSQMVMERLRICKECPSKKYIVQYKRCAECGCFVNVKAALAQEHCPLNHW